jgi:hypothetical protein
MYLILEYVQSIIFLFIDGLLVLDGEVALYLINLMVVHSILYGAYIMT